VSKEPADLALDTNAVIAYRGDDSAAAAIMEASGSIAIPVVVFGELGYGALHSAKPQENLERLRALLGVCAVLEITLSTAQRYAEIRQALSVIGRPIPEADLWIASACLE